jgi:tetratricopeptide (TPR) repeat protein
MRAKMFTMRREVAGVLCLLLVSTAYGQPPTAGSPAELEQRSKTHYKLGVVHLDMQEYDAAIREFETGYDYKPLPLFLYNIARVAVLAGHRQVALEYYLKYLEAKPNAPERAEVEQRIRDLQHSLAQRPEKQPVETPPPVVATVEPPPVVSAPAPMVEAPAVTQSLTADVPPAKKSHKTAIALGIVGGVLVVGAAVAVGVVLSSKSTDLHNWGTLTANGSH